jgi:hypothetical protein
MFTKCVNAKQCLEKIVILTTESNNLRNCALIYLDHIVG